MMKWEIWKEYKNWLEKNIIESDSSGKRSLGLTNNLNIGEISSEALNFNYLSLEMREKIMGMSDSERQPFIQEMLKQTSLTEEQLWPEVQPNDAYEKLVPWENDLYWVGSPIDSNNERAVKISDDTEIRIKKDDYKVLAKLFNTFQSERRNKIEEQMGGLKISGDSKNVRNILLMGRTGGGKSTLGNVLIDAEKFGVSHKSISETKDTHIEELEMPVGTETITYRIVDTIGLGDTNLDTKAVLWKLATIAYEIKNGLNQVLFVTRGRFTKEEIEAYELLRSVIFDSGVDKYTTIVKTGFVEFEEEDKCEEDRQGLLNENTELSRLAGRVRKILYVDNPPIDMTGDGKKIKAQIALNKETREESRTRLLTYLGTCQGNYKPVNLDEMNERVGDYMSDDEKLRKRMEELEKQRSAEAERFRKELKDIEEKRTKELIDINQKYANDQQKLQAEIQRVNNEAALRREESEKEQARLDKVAEAEARRIDAETQMKKEQFALQVQRENAGVLKKVGGFLFGW